MTFCSIESNFGDVSLAMLASDFESETSSAPDLSATLGVRG
jgi:hypothetical protein